MPLYLATHRIEVVTAKVPLCMVLLLDNVKHNKGTSTLPAELRPRMVIPTDSTISSSLWDAPSADLLLAWLFDSLGPDVTHEVHEVQEEFSWGISFEINRARAAEKMAAGSRDALGKISATAAKAGGGIQRQLEALDQRTNILTAAENAFNRVRSATTTTTTAGSATGGPAPGAAAAPVPEPAYGSTTAAASGGTTTSAMLAANVSAGLTKASSTLSWLGSALKEQIVTATTVATTATTARPPSSTGNAPQPGGMDDHLSPVPSYDAAGPPHTEGDGQHRQQQQHPQAGAGAGLVFVEDEDVAPVARLPQLPVSSPATAPAPGTPVGAAAAEGAAAGATR